MNEPIPATVKMLNLQGYRQLRESEEGLLGQVGWVPWREGEPEPIYDPDAQVWEVVSEETGKYFMWRRGVQCFGVPSGSCNNQIKPGGGSYCHRCDEAYDRQGKDWRNGERRKVIISDGVYGGWIPKLFQHDEVYATLEPQQMKAYVELQAHDLQCAWIVGEHGRGKTVLCFRIMADYLKHCRTVAYCDAPIIGRSMKDHRLMTGLCEADLLVIDDLPKNFNSSWLVSQLHAILNARHLAEKRTLVTSEMSPKECNVAFMALGATPATLDRLNFPKAICYQCTIEGQNLRR